MLQNTSYGLCLWLSRSILYLAGSGCFAITLGVLRLVKNGAKLNKGTCFTKKTRKHYGKIVQFWWVQVFFCVVLLSSEFFFGEVVLGSWLLCHWLHQIEKANFFVITEVDILHAIARWAGLLRKRLSAALLSSWVVSLGFAIWDGWSLMKFWCYRMALVFSEEAWSKRYKGVTGVFFFLLSFSGDVLFLPVFARKKQFCTWWQIKRNLRQDNQTQSRQATWRWFAFLISPYFTVKNKVSLGLRPLPVQPVPGHFDCSTRQLDGWTILKAINGLGNKYASEYTFHLFLQYLLDKRWLCKQMDRPDVKRKYTNVGKSVDMLAWRSDTWPTKQQRWCCRTWCFTMWFTEFSTKRLKKQKQREANKKNTQFWPLLCKHLDFFLH